MVMGNGTPHLSKAMAAWGTRPLAGRGIRVKLTKSSVELWLDAPGRWRHAAPHRPIRLSVSPHFSGCQCLKILPFKHLSDSKARADNAGLASEVRESCSKA